MSFWDNVKKFAQPYADDEYDDYDEDEEYLDEYEAPEQPARRAPVRRGRPAPAPLPEEEEDDDFGFAMSAPATSAPSTSGGFSGQVLKMAAGPKQEVVLFRPQSFNETSRAADHLKNGKAVVLNLEDVDKAMSRRVVDILSGAVYALEGDVTKIAKSAYLFYPKNMDVSGTLESLAEEIESYT